MSVVYREDLHEMEVPLQDCSNCSNCGEPVTLPGIYWHGAQPLLFHPSCARSIGVHLIADSREADLASGLPHWTRRSVRATRAALLLQELGGAA